MSKKMREKKERRLQEQQRREQASSFRRLARKAQEHAGERAIVIRDPKGLRKMSEILEEFAQPLLQQAEVEEYPFLLKIASIAWNLSLLAEKDFEEEIAMITKVMQHPMVVGDFRMNMKALVDRKRELYPNEKRRIIDFDFQIANGGMRINVVSAPLDDPTVTPESLGLTDSTANLIQP